MEESELTKHISSQSKTAGAFNRLYELISVLRAPNGCPWDRDQSPLSMRRDLIEEVFEAVDAISADDALHAKEELGDVMLNACMVSYMYEQHGDFTVADSINELCDKLVRRHPHVFKESAGKSEMTEKVENSAQVLNQWDRIKENIEGRSAKSILDEVPEGFPPLLKAYKMQKKAAKKGFDWDELAPVAAKVTEEFGEVQEAAEQVKSIKEKDKSKDKRAASAGEQDSERKNGVAEIKPFTVSGGTPELDNAQLHLEEEFGDLLFAVVNYARHLGVDPEVALNRTNKKFYNRFTFVEREMEKAGKTMEDGHLCEMDAFWDEAKKRGL
jgi:tetrapyrrole methylase family protein / MazG family protein